MDGNWRENEARHQKPRLLRLFGKVLAHKVRGPAHGLFLKKNLKIKKRKLYLYAVNISGKSIDQSEGEERGRRRRKEGS